MGWFLKASLLAREWRHNARFEQATREPESAQARVLQDLVRRNADTAFGGANGFAKIRSHADYTRDVPVRDYEGFRPHINAILSGAQRILTAENPYMFTSTSGTTASLSWCP
jgi:GH3 auxin-responsive promoter